MCLCLCTICGYPQRQEECARSTGAGVIGGGEPQMWWLKLNLATLQKQKLLLTVQTSLQSSVHENTILKNSPLFLFLTFTSLINSLCNNLICLSHLFNHSFIPFFSFLFVFFLIFYSFLPPLSLFLPFLFFFSHIFSLQATHNSPR